MSAAFELTRKLVGARDESAPEPEATRSPLKGLRYWLWRLGGRRHRAIGDMSHFAKLADNYDHDLARQRARVAELERLTGQLQTAFEHKIATLQRQHAEEVARLRADRPALSQPGLEARAAEAEARARLAENKVEMLKEALDITRARNDGNGATDSRFRDAKRAFARLFHPDQGGRNNPDKERVFLEFWPVLDRIERGE
ncbi:MAG: hypothetical protein K2X44_02735 [Magnetospirillum sp.]|nr:hypothetical protein [Magnetospirillum sp.]